jgi:RNA polymerase sigma factor (sigma-70 family)
VSPPPFESLLREHQGSLHRYLVFLVGRDDAPDCLQETLIAALRAYPPSADDNLRAWLFTIAHHKGIDHHRRRVRRAVPTASLADVGISPAEPDLDLWRVVSRLPTKQRGAVTLRFAGDLAYAEIASVLDVTEAAARQNVRAGLRNLRTMLGEEAPT